MNNKGEATWVNDGFFRMYDIYAEQQQNVYGASLEIIHKNAMSLVKVKEACEKGQVQSFNFKLFINNKKEKWIQSVITPIINDHGICDQLIAIETDITRLKKIEEQLSKEKEKADSALKKILPEEVAEELKLKGKVTPRYYKLVTVLFADVKGFLSFCKDISPQQLLNELNEYFDEFDEIVQNNNVEKIKTIGDAYMCAGGLPMPNKTHPFDVVLVGLQIQDVIQKINEKKLLEGRMIWRFRIGIHTGDIISGVIGKHKFAFDILGDTVNKTARMEVACDTGKINISEKTYEIIKGVFDCQYRGDVEVKNQEHYDMYYVTGLKKEFADENNNLLPNKKFAEYMKKLG